MYPQVLFQNRKPDRIATLEEYRQSGGYAALADVLRQRTPKQVQQELLDAMLLGRGGAAFPAGRKLMTVADDAPFPRFIVCNADEMEPGTFKDRVLIHADPHQLIEGMILLAYAARAAKGFIFIRPEYENAARILERELALAREAGYLGRDILGSPYAFDIEVHRSGGRYICGEVTAQINAIQGRRPNPLQPPPYPTEHGLWGQPTDLQNVETLACVPHIMRHGAAWFRNLALTETGGGTKIFCVSGKVNRPGCYELPMGVPLREIIEVHAGGDAPGQRIQGLSARRGLHALSAPGILRHRHGLRAAAQGRAPPGDRGHHGFRSTHLSGRRHAEPADLFRARILRVVHPLPRGAAVPERSVGTHRAG